MADKRLNPEKRAKLKWLRSAVTKGLDEIERGDGPAFRSIDELEWHIDQLGSHPPADLGRNGERGSARRLTAH